MTHEVVPRSTTTELYFKENYLQKIRKLEKQVKKIVTKQATMDGMRAHG